MPPTDANKLMLDTIIRGLEQANQSMKELQQKVHANDLTLTQLEGDVFSIKKDVNELVTIIRGNNSKDTIVNRVAALEHEQKTMLDFMEEAKNIKKEEVTEKWKFKALIATGIISTVGSLIALAGQFLMK